MYIRGALVVFLLLCTVGAIAADTDQSEKSEKAQKAVLFMKNLGLSSEAANNTADYVGSRFNDGRFDVAKGEFEGMQLNLRYDTGAVKMENLELQMKFNQDDPYNVTACSNGVMFHYKVAW